MTAHGGGAFAWLFLFQCPVFALVHWHIGCCCCCGCKWRRRRRRSRRSLLSLCVHYVNEWRMPWHSVIGSRLSRLSASETQRAKLDIAPLCNILSLSFYILLLLLLGSIGTLLLLLFIHSFIHRWCDIDWKWIKDGIAYDIYFHFFILRFGFLFPMA